MNNTIITLISYGAHVLKYCHYHYNHLFEHVLPELILEYLSSKTLIYINMCSVWVKPNFGCFEILNIISIYAEFQIAFNLKLHLISSCVELEIILNFRLHLISSCVQFQVVFNLDINELWSNLRFYLMIQYNYLEWHKCGITVNN